MTENDNQIHVQLTGDVGVSKTGEFEIIAITAGEGNGWLFSSDCLRSSLSLGDGVDCYIDHEFIDHPSVRNLAGVCYSPTYDDVDQSIRLKLKTTGPSGPLLDQVGREWLASPDPKPHVGFSADVFFTAIDQSVVTILKVQSLDIVMTPARGGQFIRALNQEKGLQMEKILVPVVPDKEKPDEDIPVASQEVDANLKAVETMLQVQKKNQAIDDEVEKSRSVRLQMCGYLLDSALSAAHLPKPATDQLRLQFQNKLFEPADLQKAIDQSRDLVSQLQAGAMIAGSGRIDSMLSTEDRLQAAVDDLFGAPRDQSMKDKEVERLSGIKELYLMLTGDVEMKGLYDASRVRLATTATMPKLVLNAMNKIILEQWDQLGKAGYRWWEPIVSIEHFTSLQSITGINVGEVGLLPEVAEGADYGELPIADSGEAGVWKKWGGYLPLTIELLDRDDTAKLRTFPRKLANASLRRLSSLISTIFTVNAGAGPVMSDTGNLFNATPIATPGGHANLLTTALASPAWEAASAAVFNQPMLVASGEIAPKLGADPKFLLVPRALRLTGMRILYPSFEREATIFSENMQRGEYGDVVTVPEWTDTTDWAAVVDPRIAPAIIVGERFGLKPEIFIAGDPLSPAMFTNDEVRLKIRHFLSVFVGDFRPLHKNNVA
jgi:hypothetical protein